MPSGLAAVLFASHAIFVALLAHFVLRTSRSPPARVLGIIIGFVGLVLVFLDRMSGAALVDGRGGDGAHRGDPVRRPRDRAPRSAEPLHAVVLSCIGAGIGAVLLLAASLAVRAAAPVAP